MATYKDTTVRGNTGISIVDVVDTAVVEVSGRISLVDSMIWEIHGVRVHDIGDAGCSTRPPRRRGTHVFWGEGKNDIR